MERKTLREYMELLLEARPDDGAREALKAAGLRLRDQNNAAAVNLALLDKALRGDVAAYKMVRDLVGEMGARNEEEALEKAAALLDGVDSAF